MSYLATNETAKALELLKSLYPEDKQYDGGSKALLALALIRNGEVEEGKKLLNSRAPLITS